MHMCYLKSSSVIQNSAWSLFCRGLYLPRNSALTVLHETSLLISKRIKHNRLFVIVYLKENNFKIRNYALYLNVQGLTLNDAELRVFAIINI